MDISQCVSTLVPPLDPNVPKQVAEKMSGEFLFLFLFFTFLFLCVHEICYNKLKNLQLTKIFCAKRNVGTIGSTIVIIFML